MQDLRQVWYYLHVEDRKIQNKIKFSKKSNMINKINKIYHLRKGWLKWANNFQRIRKRILPKLKVVILQLRDIVRIYMIENKDNCMNYHK
jgi:hypothetical protein